MHFLEPSVENDRSTLASAKSAWVFVFYHKQVASGADCRHTRSLKWDPKFGAISAPEEYGGRAGQPARSGMACFVDTGYCCLFCRSFPDYFPIVDAGEALTRGGYWKRGILPPSMCDWGVGRPGEVCKWRQVSHDWGELRRKSLDH